MAEDLLQEDGSQFLLEDDSGVEILEASTETVPSVSDTVAVADAVFLQSSHLVKIREIGLAGNTQYEARIRSISRTGEISDWSDIVTGLTVQDVTPPQTPTGLTLSNGPGRTNQATWKAVTAIDVISYSLYRSTVNDFAQADRLVRVSSLQYVDADPALTAGVTYYYWVLSEDRTGNLSAPSDVAVIIAGDVAGPDTTPPEVPGFITATSFAVVTSDGTATIVLELAWGEVLDTDLSFYDVQFKRTIDTVWTIRHVPNGATGLREYGVIGNTAYDIRVRAVDVLDNRSDFVTGTHFTALDGTPPGVPTVVDALGGFQLVALSWVPPADPDLDQIEIWRSEVNNSAGAVKVGQTRATVYMDTGLANGTTYYYWLKARDFSGNLSPFHTAPGSGVQATTVVIGPDDVLSVGALLTKTAQIQDAIITNAKIINLAVDKLQAGTIGAQLIKLGANQFELDGANVYMRILDTQSPSPFTRVKIGKLGVSAVDYGIEIYGTDGGLQWRADGLQMQGYGRDAGVQASVFAYYHKAVCTGVPGYSWRTAALTLDYVKQAGDRLEYDILFEDTDVTATKGGFELYIPAGPHFLNTDGGNDQNGLSSHMDTLLGQRALNQWYHRVITLPTSWNGLVITEGATAMNLLLTVGESRTMLIKNVKITDSNGILRKMVSQDGLVAQDVWTTPSFPGGAESNVTVTARRESLASMVPPEQIMNDAVSRAGMVTASSLEFSGSAETVVATFADVVWLMSSDDTIRSWVHWKADFNPWPDNGIVYIRVRRDGLAGPVVFAQSITIVGATKTAGSSAIGGGSFVDYTLEEPETQGFVSYVITVQAPANGTTFIDAFKMLQIARSK